ncbi:MAG: hypothetical protein KF856_04015 [Cyclobacteriaceae bacterium]|nr:hypothetical protein [Cyclobacteriaceae bacterium]
MKIRIVFIAFALFACSEKNGSSVATSEKERLPQNLKLYSGDSVEIAIDHGLNVDLLEPVDSVFYFTYLHGDSHFCGFRQKHLKEGGPDCEQFYFGEIRSRSDYEQLLVIQRYAFNDIINSVFLLTFDKDMNLKSVLEVASLIHQAELEPNFKSIIYNDSITKFEITRNLMPEDIVENRWLICRDSLTRKFKFQEGKYTLSRLDSVRLCNWIIQD